jgi:hypothetical protein
MENLPLGFGPDDILAFEEIHGSSGELQEIHVILNDGSRHLCKELLDMGEILAMLKELENRKRTQLLALSTKVRHSGSI